jgi:hypothetical protein
MNRINDLFRVFGLSLFILLVYNYFAGQDLNWDQINYHYYSGYLATNLERIREDFFAASIQGYLAPFSFLPFYLFASSGLPALAVSSLLVVVHAINVVLLWLVAKNLSIDVLPSTRLLFNWFAVLIGTLSPIFLTQVGSSFNDVIVSIPVLAAFAVVTGRGTLASRSMISGLLAGVAISLKLTNLPFAVGLGAAIFLHSKANGFRGMLHQSLLFSLSVVGGFLLIAGVWVGLLWREFGNPFFPFFNKFFQSPDYALENIRHYRYLPADLTDALSVPFRMALPDADVYTETFSPDSRFAFLIVFLSAGLVATFIGKCRLCDFSSRRSLFFLAFFIGFAFWLISSGNGRYLMPLTLLVGPAIAAVLADFGLRALVYGFICIFCMQAVGLVWGADRRWSEGRWQGDGWFHAEFTERFRTERTLYLTVGLQPNAFVIPFASSNSVFSNVIGQNPISLDGFGGERLQRLLNDYRSSLRVLFSVSQFTEDLNPILEKRLVSDRLKNFNLKAKFDLCEYNKIWKLGGTRVLKSASETRYLPDAGFMYIVTCPVEFSTADDTFALAKAQAHRRFAAIEAACPLVMQPKGISPYFSSGRWEKFYINTDIFVRLDGDSVRISGYMIPPTSVSIDELVAGRCPSLDRRTYRP